MCYCFSTLAYHATNGFMGRPSAAINTPSNVYRLIPICIIVPDKCRLNVENEDTCDSVHRCAGTERGMKYENEQKKIDDNCVQANLHRASLRRQ